MSLRKTMILTTDGPDGAPGAGPAFTFKRLTFKQEGAFRDFARKKQREYIAAGIKADGGCGLTSSFGIQMALDDDEGQRLFLKLAAQEVHPEATDELIAGLMSEYFEKCLSIIMGLLPFAKIAPRLESKYLQAVVDAAGDMDPNPKAPAAGPS